MAALKERMAEAYAKEHGVEIDEARSKVTVADDINLVMLIQIPLQVKKVDQRPFSHPNHTSVLQSFK